MVRRSLLCGLILLLLGGCSTGYAPVTDQSLGAQRALAPVGADEYRVRPGDTLMAIAFRLGLDYRELARINRLRDEDLIYAGQVLKTRRPATTRTQTTAATQPARSTRSQPTPKTQTAQAAAPAEERPEPVATQIRWRWPHAGRLLARFDNRDGGNKGLDIAGRIGEPVKAAADGEVVYAGSGLLGYGNLVIISHSRAYLSAYAHNSRILVKEKQKIKAGEIVAELGNTGATRPMLHFEIRRDGKPVDPLRYLPRR